MAIRVLVVDDSAVVQRVVSDVLNSEPDIEVVGRAADGAMALQLVESLSPHLVTLDIEMPVMDGLEALAALRATHPWLPVVVFSTLTERGAAATLRALELGATDYVTKPSRVDSLGAARAEVRAQLVPTVRSLAGRAAWYTRSAVSAPMPHGVGSGVVSDVDTRRPTTSSSRTPAPGLAQRRGSSVRVVVIGASTGGPEALARVLERLPADLPVPVLAVQHMPPVFTHMFAERLDSKVGLNVREAADGDAVEPGTVLIAPGDHHMCVAPGEGERPLVELHQGPKENFCRPAVDVLFRSAAAHYGAGALGVVLTGMGADGAEGSRSLKASGAEVLVQDRDTSVVWGMPGAVVAAGLADQVLPLSMIAEAVTARCRPTRRDVAATASAGGVL